MKKYIIILFSLSTITTASAAKWSDYGTTNVLLSTDKFVIAHGTSTNYGVTWLNLGMNMLDFLSTNTVEVLNVDTLNVTNWISVKTGNTNASAIWGPNGDLTNGTPVSATYVLTGTLTNQVYGSNVVNGMSVVEVNTGVIAMGKVTYTNLSADITIAGFSGINTVVWQNANLVVTNSHASTTYKVTFPSGVQVATNSFCLGQDIWVTNKTKVIVAIATGLDSTNVAAVRFPPQ
jgi:hypothetical protein